MRIINFITGTILFILSSSCQKGFDNSVPPIPLGNADSFYVSKIYIIDSTKYTEDTSAVLRYTYDDRKRVNSITVVSNFPETLFKELFFYNGDEQKPYKASIFDRTEVLDTTYIFNFFDASGRRVKDSSIEHGYDTISSIKTYENKIINYSYARGYAYRRTTVYDSVANVFGNTKVIFDTAVVDGLYNEISNINNDEGVIAKTNVFYFNSQNPFYNLNIYKNEVVFIDYDGLDLLSYTYYNPMIVLLTLNSSGGGAGVSREILFDYAFDANGNVYEKIIKNDDTGNGYIKNIFEYIILK